MYGPSIISSLNMRRLTMKSPESAAIGVLHVDVSGIARNVTLPVYKLFFLTKSTTASTFPKAIPVTVSAHP